MHVLDELTLNQKIIKQNEEILSFGLQRIGGYVRVCNDTKTGDIGQV